MSFSPDGNTIALSNTRKIYTPLEKDGRAKREVDCDLHLLDAKSGETITTLDGYSGECKALDFSSSGKMLAVASWRELDISLWNATTGKLISTLEGHKEGNASLHFSKDENTLVSVGYDCTLKIWDCRQKRPVTTYQLPGPGSHVINSSDGKLIALVFDKAFDASNGSILRVIDRAKLTTIMEVPVSWGSESITFTPNDEQLLVFHFLEKVDFYDVLTGKLISTLNPKGEMISELTVSPTGHWLAYSHEYDRRSKVTLLTLWDTQRQIDLGTMEIPTVLGAIAFSPSGKRLLTVGAKSVQLWDVGHLLPQKQN